MTEQDCLAGTEPLNGTWQILTRRAWAFCVFSALVALAAGAIDLNLPWLVAENQRIEPWEIPLVWLSEAAAALLFLHYFAVTIVSGSPPTHRTALPAIRFFLASCLVTGIFLAVGMVQERLAFASAVHTQSQVIGGRSFVQSTGHRKYTLHCSFVDRSGRVRRAWFPLLADQTPVEVRTAVDGRNLPVAFEVLYDPARPGRSWPANLPYSDDNRLYMYSLLNLMLSTPLTVACSTLRKRWSVLPPAEAVPLVAGTALLYAVGTLGDRHPIQDHPRHRIQDHGAEG